MALSSIQHQIAQFVQVHDLATTPAARLLDLVSEVGELAKEVLKASDYGQTDFTPSAAQTENWNEELADVLFALICLANSTQVDLDSALNSVLAKYSARMQAKGEAGSGR